MNDEKLAVVAHWQNIFGKTLKSLAVNKRINLGTANHAENRPGSIKLYFTYIVTS